MNRSVVGKKSVVKTAEDFFDSPHEEWLKERGTAVHCPYDKDLSTPAMIGLAIMGPPKKGKVIGEFVLYQDRVEVFLN